MNGSQVDPNPYAPPQSRSEPQDSQPIAANVPVGNVNWDRLLLGINVTICAVAAPAAFAEIESVVFSGMAISGAGLALVLREMSCRRRGRSAWWLNLFLGCAGPTMAVTLTAIIAYRRWSPQDAERYKVPWVVAAFAVGFVALSVASYLKYPPDPRR